MHRPAAIRPGNSAGPTGCPGILGKACTEIRTVAPRASSTSPKMASLSFIGAGLFDQADGLHCCAQVRVGLRHEAAEILRTCIDHTEATAGHEVRVFLARCDFAHGCTQ